ncbi:AMP-binding protein [Paludicola sp. MB14-C6]|uniref:AMP-binding protein n=1 Tax=Paludihabitans sp. MB14-C6 TaxID=3070656 RepID=UPI0027DDC140|nr:AMP-binding protein [Paludicola sp. MB14-C6]WMJ22299.1 AMP-binding protein [Paludicola sp. MB14-C6]
MDKLMEITVGNLLEEVEKKYPDQQAVKYIDRDYCRSWKEFNQEVDEIAKGFVSIGVNKGDHVAIWATNVPEWLLTLFACAKIGAILVTVNTNYKVFELEYVLRQSDAKVLVMTKGTKYGDYVQIVNELCPTLVNQQPNQLDFPMLPFLKSVILTENEAPAGMMAFSKLYENGKVITDEEYIQRKAQQDFHDVVNMQYTSGTTGFPKGVMLTHYNIVNNGKCIGDCMKFTHEDKLCIPVPFFHCFGLVLAIMACLTHATSMVPLESYRPIDFLRALDEEECTAIHGVPTMYIAALEHSDFKKFKFPKLRTGIMAGSPCPIKVMQQVINDMGMHEITIAFGQTEASPVCTMTTTDDSIEHRVSTVGKAMPHVECKIVDVETGETLGVGQQGEFCARGYNIMKGYYKMEEATAQAIDKDGWLHTGDLCEVDEHGYYKVTGRIKDMIIRGGENIYPKELEEFIYTIENVKDVQVIGVPSEQYGEEVMACIILKDGVNMTSDEVKDIMRQNMARHKVPSYIEFVKEFPMNAAGKIMKFKMREWAVEKLNLQKANAIETA